MTASKFYDWRQLYGRVNAGDPRWRRCRCPKWVRGVLPYGEPVRKSAEADPTAADHTKPRRTTLDQDSLPG